MPPTNGSPAISVVVPAYNAAHTLGACLDALQHQTTSPDDYEIIVADDGSTDETGQVAAAAGVQLVRQAHNGPATARNLGVSRARGRIIMFTDADCVPAPNWVEEMRRSVSADGVKAAKGAYRTRQREVVARLAQIEFEERYLLLEKHPYIDFFDTHAVALDKAAFDASGGFDPLFPFPNNEDVDLAYRFSQRGHRVVFTRAAVVFHRHVDSWRKYATQKVWRGYWRLQVYRRYPRKAVTDSYTPQTLKLQILLLYAGLPMVPLAILWPVIGWAVALVTALLLLTMLPLASLAWRQDRRVAPFVPWFVCVRAFAIGAGSALGLMTVLRIIPLLGRRQGYRWAKRMIDVTIAAVALVIVSPLVLLLGLLIKLDSRGPIIHRQPRLGYRKGVFDLYKLRTMHVDGLREGSKPSSPYDERVTRIGRWLRRSSLDELPQLLNIVHGDMSLVGPRPEQAYLLERYPPGMERRFDAKPGLTGWWQVNGRRQPMYEHLDYDLYYVEHQSLWLDLKILLMTVRAVFSGEGAV